MGRVYVKSPVGHPRIRKDGFIRRTYLIAEQMLGRLLEHGEVVHHINGNTEDDSPENLLVLSLGEHSALHQRQRVGIPHPKKSSKANICRHGHEFSPDNTRLYLDKKGKTQRICKACDRLKRREYYAMGKYHYKKATE